MERSEIALVIPAFNEAASIGPVVEKASVYGQVIVVNDGSSDRTEAVAKQAGALVVTHSHNQGYDAALNSGCAKADALGMKVIITLDADGQHDPDLVSRFIESIMAGHDIVVGARNCHARFSETLFSWYTNIRFGLKDPLCGMKAYRTEVYRALGHFDSYKSIGTELAIFAFKSHYRTAQICFKVKERIGEPRFGRALIANYKILRAMLFSFWL